VRYISNASSGKMGIAIAEAALARSKETVFIHGPIDASLLSGKKFRLLSVESTEDMLGAVLAELESDCVLIMAAAPADYRPETKHPVKIKKEAGIDEITIKLIKNPDILKTITERRKSFPGIFVTGFAAETNNTEENALKKFTGKQLDMICLNDVTRTDAGFGSDNNRITIFTRGIDGPVKTELPLLSKSEAAGRILDSIGALLI
jgi:phosphopantothenoylcysteine synthetase/decarboxylase